MKTTYYPCKHCEGTGTCRVNNDSSCAICLKEAKVKKQESIVRCGVCFGIGVVEPKTERLQRRLPFVVAMAVLAVFYFYSFFNIFQEDKFNQIFPVITSLTTMIVTFYFSRK